MKKQFWLFSLVLILVACNKEQRLVDRLDGTWTVESVTYKVNGQDVGSPIGQGITQYFIFEACSLAEDNVNSCDGLVHFKRGETLVGEDVFRYYFLDKASKIVLDYSDPNTRDITADILSSSKSRFEFDYTRYDGSDTLYYKYVLVK